MLKYAAMKKIASIICVSLLVFAAADAFSAETETIPQLKAKIAKLESQIKDDAIIIGAIRTENRELKKQIRKMKRAAAAASLTSADTAKMKVEMPSANAESAEKKTSPRRAERKSPAESYRSTVDASVAPKVVEPQETETPKPANSSIWDNMFPF